MSQAISIFNRPRLDADLPAPPALGISGTLDNYEVGAAYSERLQIDNAIGKCTVAVVSSDLPGGSLVYVDNFTKEVVVSWPAFSLTATNVLQNGGFEEGNVAWQLAGPWEINNTGDAETGSYSAEFRKGTRGEFTMVGAAVPVSGPTSITINGRVQQGASSAGNAGAGVGLRWYGAGDSLLADNFGTLVSSGSGGAWNDATYSGSNPSGATRVAPLVRGFRNRENKALWVDNLSWDHEYFAGDDSEDDYSLSIEVTDSAGRVAAWSGTVSSMPSGPFDPALSLSIYNKTSEWWNLDSPGYVAGGFYWQAANKHPRVTTPTNNDLSLNRNTPYPTITGVRGSGSLACDISAGTRMFLSGSQVDLDMSGPVRQRFEVFGWARFNAKAGSLQVLQSWWPATNPSTMGFLISVDGADRIQFQVGGTAYRSVHISTAGIPAGQWFFYNAWLDSDLYPRASINAGSVTTGATPASGTIGPYPIIMGALQTIGDYKFNGALQDWGFVRNNVLTPAERTMLYNAGQGAKWSEILLSAGI